MALTAITASRALSFMANTAQLYGLWALKTRDFWPYFYNTMAVNAVKIYVTAVHAVSPRHSA